MARLPKDEFSHQLNQLMRFFPEYAYILQFLIELVQKEKEARIQAKLQRLKETDW